jgi:hypothetical protein
MASKNEDVVRKQLEKAQKLIKAKKFEDARAILLTLDDPTAEKWLARLNDMNANTPQTIVVQEKKKRGCLSTMLSIIGAAFLVIICAAVYSASNGSTPSPSGNAAGSRNSPFPAGSAQDVRDGSFRVNSIQENMTAEVHRMNMFNPEPDAGQEWTLVDVTFSCSLSSDEVCTTSFMQFELVGKLGQAYNQQFVAVLDRPFGLEVFGGGQTTGSVGFIVDSSDSEFLFVVVDGGRKFFAIP